jgi:hypothetical protein
MICRGVLLLVFLFADIDSGIKRPRLLLKKFKSFADRLRRGYMRAKFRNKLEMNLALRVDSVLSDGPPSDVRIMNHLPLTVLGQILTEGILIYSIDEDTRIELETSIRHLYFDFLPFIQKYQREYLSQSHRND